MLLPFFCHNIRIHLLYAVFQIFLHLQNIHRTVFARYFSSFCSSSEYACSNLETVYRKDDTFFSISKFLSINSYIFFILSSLCSNLFLFYRRFFVTVQPITKFLAILYIRHFTNCPSEPMSFS